MIVIGDVYELDAHRFGAMAAYFNLFAGFVALYKPRDVPLLSARHHQGGERSAHQCGKPLLLVDLF